MAEALGGLLEAARSVRGGTGGLMISGTAAYSSPYVVQLKAPFDYATSGACAGFFIVGLIIMTWAAVRKLIYG
jgi:hypothetical protein